MPTLAKCEIARGDEPRFFCLGCDAPLRDIKEATKDVRDAVFLCPRCRRFFDKRGVIPYETADEMFPGESDYMY